MTDVDIRIGINGFGRIGRDVFRCGTDRAENGLRIVAVNDITGPDALPRLPWRELGVDIVIEATGRFRTRTPPPRTSSPAHAKW